MQRLLGLGHGCMKRGVLTNLPYSVFYQEGHNKTDSFKHLRSSSCVCVCVHLGNIALLNLLKFRVGDHIPRGFETINCILSPNLIMSTESSCRGAVVNESD